MSTRVELQVPDELLRTIDRCRGHEPRASFIRRLVEEYVADDQELSPRMDAAMKATWLDDSVLESSVYEGTDVLSKLERGSPADNIRQRFTKAHLPQCSCGICKPPR